MAAGGARECAGSSGLCDCDEKAEVDERGTARRAGSGAGEQRSNWGARTGLRVRGGVG
jgi:hypothetical protein